MTQRFVRASKYRHAFGKAEKKDQGYEGFRINKNHWDSNFCDVNSKFLALSVDGSGGAFIVMPLEHTGRQDINMSKVCGHSRDVLDLAWCPFNENVIASCSDDMSVKIWEIPDGGLTSNMTECLASLDYHQKRVGVIKWHPTAQGILASAGSDHLLIIWNVEDGSILSELELSDIISSISWNVDGSLIATTTKDKLLRVLDPRSQEILYETQCQDGSKLAQVLFLRNGDIFTSCFSKRGERVYALWNPDLTIKGERVTIDTSSGVNMLFYDQDSNMIYLVGKGDCIIRYYEISDEEPYVHWLANYTAITPQRGVAFLPRRCLDTKLNEVSRLYRLTSHAGKDFVEIVRFTVPRKSDLFQDDLYPPCFSGEPSMSAEQWMTGLNVAQKTVDLRSSFKGTVRAKPGTGRPMLAKKVCQPLAEAHAQAEHPIAAEQPKLAARKNHVEEKPAPAIQTAAASPSPQLYNAQLIMARANRVMAQLADAKPGSNSSRGQDLETRMAELRQSRLKERRAARAPEASPVNGVGGDSNGQRSEPETDTRLEDLRKALRDEDRRIQELREMARSSSATELNKLDGPTTSLTRVVASKSPVNAPRSAMEEAEVSSRKSRMNRSSSVRDDGVAGQGGVFANHNAVAGARDVPSKRGALQRQQLSVEETSSRRQYQRGPVPPVTSHSSHKTRRGHREKREVTISELQEEVTRLRIMIHSHEDRLKRLEMSFLDNVHDRSSEDD